MAEVGWRSTTLSLASEHCPKALEFYEKGAPYDRGIFAVGTAAHAILEEIGKATVAAGHWLYTEEAEELVRGVCERLIRDGRDFEGVREPPLPAEAVWKGLELALSYQDSRMASSKYQYEVGLAVNRDWQPCPFDGGAWLRARFDAVGTKMPDWFEDDQGGPILEVLDYKSAYSAKEDEVRTLQRKIQGVLAWDRWGKGHDAMRLVVVNFRLRKEYELVVYPHEPEGAMVLDRWRKDIESEIRVREQQRGPNGERPAVPGVGCLGCPYLNQCEDARPFLEPVYGTASPHDMAQRYAVLRAYTEMLEEPLREAACEEPVEIPGGYVGFSIKEQSVLKASAPEVLAQEWLRGSKPRDLEAAKAGLPGLIQAMKPGMAQAKALLTHLRRGSDEERDKRAAILGSLTTTRRVSEFGVHREKESE